METAPLKSFATWARRELITQVSARLTAVLAPASPERVENQRTVAMLERDIATAGGGAKGKDAVADKVAYTWFNRIIALRFMDANGYTGSGVVSPAPGQQTGQPEILADAKRGSIDPAVVSNKRTLDAITGLLDGTRPSADAQGEAYTLLLAEYCRYWNRSMPFMFEREGDYTELLIPANLLAADSILSKAASTLTAEVCRDVEVIGWLYQFYIAERKDEVFAGFKKGKKAGADEIPAATQLFTPHWIVRYLVENSLGRLWMLNHPSSRLIEQMDYYIAPADEEADFLTISSPEELKIIDPACGSGHMLTYAFDLLYAIYEEEGYAPSEIPERILAHNLYGTEIDPRAGALAAFALTMKARARQRTFLNKRQTANICVIGTIAFNPSELDFLLTHDGDQYSEEAFWNQFKRAEVFGSLIRPKVEQTAELSRHLEELGDGGDILEADLLGRAAQVVRQAELLAGKYSVVVANPPYMGTKNMSAELSDYAKAHYPDTKTDLFAMFIERCQELTEADGGHAALITMQSWMFLSSFERLRERLLRVSPPTSMAHLGERAFDSIGGAVVSTTAFVLEVGRPLNAEGTYLRLIDGRNEAEKSQMMLTAARGGANRYLSTSRVFTEIPGEPIVYWLSKAMRESFSKGRPLRDIAEPRKGMDTGNNARFLRAWWEVSHKSTSLTEFRAGAWVPYNKGGGFRKWYGYREFLVDWRDGGSQMRTRSGSRYFGREGWTWGTVTSGGLSMRFTPAGAAFDNGGCTLFSSNDLDVPALILNSTTADAILAAISPTLNFQPINIGAVPVVTSEELVFEAPSLVASLTAAARADWDSFETSWDFRSPAWLGDGRRSEARMSDEIATLSARWARMSIEQQDKEAAVDRLVAETYGLLGEVPIGTSLDRVSLTRNVAFRYGSGKSEEEYAALERADLVREFVSFAVGCMFGRYSLDAPGLVLADQGATLQDFYAEVPAPAFAPDGDNVLPIVDGDWFEDDIVARFRQFLRVAFGERHFEENLRLVEESLGVKSLREYFITGSGRSKFYDDHVQRYKKRPIYWLFSSPRGSFNALIYMHRYTPSTVSTVLNEYLREFESKLEANLQHQERLAAGDGTPREKAAALKEAERLRKVLVELGEYEHDVLYPLASQQIAIDLDDGVKANYPKFYPALKKIAGLEATDD